MSTDSDSAIETKRLSLQPFRKTFLTQRYVGWLNDCDVMRYSEQRHRTHTLESCREYVKSFQGTPNMLWAICTKAAEPGHIGNASAYVEEESLVADVGILIGERSVWRQGFGSEAWLGICDYLLRVRGLEKITAGTRVANQPMLGVMHRAGMQPDAERNAVFGEEAFRYFLLEKAEWCGRYPQGPFADVSGDGRGDRS